MSAPVDVLAVMDACGAYVDDAAGYPEQFKAGVVKRDQAQYVATRAAVAELIEATREFTRGMPLQFAANAAVIGNCNARQIENMRAALRNCGAQQ